MQPLPNYFGFLLDLSQMISMVMDFQLLCFFVVVMSMLVKKKPLKCGFLEESRVAVREFLDEAEAER